MQSRKLALETKIEKACPASMYFRLLVRLVDFKDTQILQQMSMLNMISFASLNEVGSFLAWKATVKTVNSQEAHVAKGHIKNGQALHCTAVWPVQAGSVGWILEERREHQPDSTEEQNTKRIMELAKLFPSHFITVFLGIMAMNTTTTVMVLDNRKEMAIEGMMLK